MNYSSAAMTIASRFRARQSKAELAYRAAMTAHPILMDAEKACRKAIISGDEKQFTLATKKRDDIITSLGYAVTDFFPLPACAKCGDSGYVGGKVCTCTRQLAATQTSGELPPDCHFEDANLDLFTGQYELHAKRSYSYMKEFCKNFPNTSDTNVLLLGTAGTGKTYLAACTANNLLEKGFGVVFVTAFRFNDLCLKYHTSFDTGKADYLNALLDCDLLVIDDLGSESILRNVTLEYLFTVIDERMRAGRHTIVTTNLSPDNIKIRYSERTASRLFSSRNCINLALGKKDLRK